MSKLLVRVPCLAITPLYLTPTRVSSEPDAFSLLGRHFGNHPSELSSVVAIPSCYSNSAMSSRNARNRRHPMSEKLLRVVLLAVACLSLFVTHAQGQDTATWQGGNGNYSNASQWLCYGQDFPKGEVPCVPNGPQFSLDLTAAGTVNVDLSVNVNSIAALPSTSFVLNGTSLTVANGLGPFLTSVNLTNGAVINPGIVGVTTQNLVMQSSTVNGEVGVSGVLGAPTGIANISGSTIQTLAVVGTFTISNSTLGDNSVLANAGQSSISNTSFNGQLVLDDSGSVVMDSSSKINSVLFGSPVDVNVALAPSSSATLTIQGGSQLIVNGANLVLGAAANTMGTLGLNDSGSVLSADKELVGSIGTGALMQTGGMNTVKQLFLGDQPGSTGTYTLSGGTLTVQGTALGGLTENFIVGNQGTGVFNQSGGTVSAPDLSLGNGASANGSYFQTGGTNTVGGLFLAEGNCLLPCSLGRATYSLSGSAVLTAQSEDVGGKGTAVFNQDGGTNNAGGGITVGGSGAFESGQGTYNLNDGKLAASTEIIGAGGIGTFNQSGGMNVTGSIDINSNSFSANPNDVYNLSAGALSAGNITNGGTFNYSGGTLTGIFSNSSGANFNISGAGTRVINGTLKNMGTVTVTSDKAQFFNVSIPSGVLKADPTAVEFQNLSIGAAGVIIGAAGDVFSITGNFQNLSTQNTLWDTGSSVLDFTAGGTHEFDLAGKSGAGFSNNFAWGTLALDPGNTLDLVLGSGDALYAFILQGLIISGNTITNIDGTPGLFLYYDAADNPSLNGNYNLTGGGELIAANGPAATPEPTTLLLFASGLGSLIARRRWRRNKRSSSPQ